MTGDRDDLFRRTDGRLSIGGVAVDELAATFGTPCYVFDAGMVEDAVARLRNGIAYRPLRILYSVKAHASVALLRLLGRLGVGADCGSPGDLAFTTAAGVPEAEVSYCGHGLSEAELDQVAASGITFVAGSLAQLEGYLRRRPGADVALRVNCGIEAGFHPSVRAGSVTSKFGIPVDGLEDAVALAWAGQARIVGLQGHLGSDITDVAPYVELLDTLLELAGRHALEPDFVDLGGGFGVPFVAGEPSLDAPALGTALATRLNAWNGGRPRPLELRLEPGAYLVRESGYLLTTVTEVVPGLVTVDSSVNHLAGALYFHAAHPLRTNGVGAKPPAVFTVAGNLMLAGDVLRRDVRMPQPAVGDVMVFALCGAYTATRASTFNQRPRPAEVLVEDGQARIIRRAETLEDLLRDQRGPTG